MNLDRVGPGKNFPNELNVIVEIPAHSDPVKYELDKETGAMFVDRFMNRPCTAPATTATCRIPYPRTATPDVMVVTTYPLIPGSVILCRPVGVLKMTDESGYDAKILAVPTDQVSHIYRDVQDLRSPQNDPRSGRPLLRALQGSGRGKVGSGRRLGGSRRGKTGDPLQRADVRGSPREAGVLAQGRGTRAGKRVGREILGGLALLIPK